MKYVSNPIIAKLKVLFNWKNEWTPIKKYLTSIYVHLETKFALLLDFIIFFLPAKQDTMIGRYKFRMGVSFGNVHFQKNFDSMFSRNFYFRIGVKVLCCCSFPEEVRTGRNRLCWQNPFKKATKWLKIKKKKVYNFRKSLPFLYQIGFSGSICKHLENGFEGS